MRQLPLWDMRPEEVEGYFPEFRPFVPLCDFPDCTHTHETGCAVKDAVARRLISVRGAITAIWGCSGGRSRRQATGTRRQETGDRQPRSLVHSDCPPDSCPLSPVARGCSVCFARSKPAGNRAQVNAPELAGATRTTRRVSPRVRSRHRRARFLGLTHCAVDFPPPVLRGHNYRKHSGTDRRGQRRMDGRYGGGRVRDGTVGVTQK